MEIYVIVECEDLSDQFECDANRTPKLILINPSSSELKKFECVGYEIYVASENGKLEKIQNYDDYYYLEE